MFTEIAIFLVSGCVIVLLMIVFGGANRTAFWSMFGLKPSQSSRLNTTTPPWRGGNYTGSTFLFYLDYSTDMDTNFAARRFVSGSIQPSNVPNVRGFGSGLSTFSPTSSRFTSGAKNGR